MARLIPIEVEDEVVQAYPSLTTSELARRFGVKRSWIEKLATKRKLKKATQWGVDIEVGTVVNDITVLNKTDKRQKHNIMYECRCKCGVEFLVRATLLRKKKIRCCTKCMEQFRSGIKHHRRGGYGPISGSQWSKIKSHANERGIDFLLSIDEAVTIFERQGGVCALSGRPIHFAALSIDISSGTASLDRIDNNGVYEPTNVRWVDKDVNMMRNKHTDAYFIELCNDVTKHNLKKTENT